MRAKAQRDGSTRASKKKIEVKIVEKKYKKKWINKRKAKGVKGKEKEDQKIKEDSHKV